jgi:hypothetical protein
LFFNNNTTAPANIVGCVIGPSLNANAANVAGAQTYSGGRANYINTAFRGNAATQSLYGIVSGTSGGTFAYNCTVYGYANNWYGAEIGTAKNCIFATDSTNYFLTAPTRTTCIAGAADVVNFVNAANGDFHLLSTATNAIGQGTSLAADAIYAFDDDLDSVTRDAAWDIGADEYQTPAPVASGASIFFFQ